MPDLEVSDASTSVARYAVEHVYRTGELERPLRELVRERGTYEVLHDEVELAVVRLADVVNVDDVRVVDAVGGASLAQHPRSEVRLAPKIGTDEFDRDDPIDEHVPRAVHDAHATFADA